MPRSATLSLAALLAVVPALPAADVDFDRDIRPLLQARCVGCHGPDKQRGGLRLDRPDALARGGDSGAAVVPGKPADSPLVRRAASADATDRMPPSGDPLTPTQVAALSAWVEAGAKWPVAAPASDPSADHWSFQPVRRPELPAVKDGAWGRNPVDRFVLARLEKEGLKPAQPADRRTLIRRLTFDLTGLPPTPEEAEAFVKDDRPDAYERLVERLLASPAHGERWARHWLDAVRFAESDGFEMNKARPNAWPYRDYVIRAFNEDRPFDRFVREQLAGDLLGEDAATGYLVAGPYDQVRSPDPVLTAQQRADELHDIVSTTGVAFLGLTVGCARCHAHKFDPVSHADYHALKAVFADVRHGERALRPPDAEARARESATIAAELSALDARLAVFVPPAHAGRVLFLDETAAGADLAPAAGQAEHAPGAGRGHAGNPADLGRAYRWWQPKPAQDLFAYRPGVAGRFRVWLSWGCGWDTHATDARYLLDRDGNPATTDDQAELAVVDQRKFADGSGDMPGKPLWSGFRAAGIHSFTPASRILLRAGATTAPVTADAIVLEEVGEAEAGETPAGPALRPPVTRGANVERFAPVEARFVRLAITATNENNACVDELEAHTAGPEPRNVALASAGAKAAASGTLPGYAIHKLEFVHDGRFGNEWSWIADVPGRSWVQVEFARPERIDRVVWSRDRSTVPRYRDRTPTAYTVEVSADGKAWRTVASSADRLPFDFPSPAGVPTAGLPPAEAAARDRLLAHRAELEARLRSLVAAPAAYLGRLGQPEEVFRLHRGEVTQPREKVGPGVPASVAPKAEIAASATGPERRRALAEWVASRDNPLTARVIVNRLWHHHFGTGIVDTPGDFGRNGGRPTHPELLDWLAADFMEHGWSLKHVHRRIVLSAAYRQSSRSDAEAAGKDAGSRLLWRFPPRRLEAEALRDAVLAVSGKLDRTVGGPGFDLFEPNGNYVKVYTPKKEFGPDTFRRMVYQSKPRMQLDDTFGAFDCPDAGQPTARRGSSTTPLQALNLLNSPFMLRQSEFFAARLEAERPDAAGRVARAFALAFGRPPAPEEAAAAERLAARHGLPALCRALFNANEFVWVR